MNKQSKKNERPGKPTPYDLGKLLDQIAADNQPKTFADVPIDKAIPSPAFGVANAMGR